MLLPFLPPVSGSPVCPACCSVSLVPHVFKLLSGLSNAISFTSVPVVPCSMFYAHPPESDAVDAPANKPLLPISCSIITCSLSQHFLVLGSLCVNLLCRICEWSDVLKWISAFSCTGHVRTTLTNGSQHPQATPRVAVCRVTLCGSLQQPQRGESRGIIVCSS